MVNTVKDRSVFLATPGLEFSQLFFPIKGIRERFIDDGYLVRAGNTFRDSGDFKKAVEQYRKALELYRQKKPFHQ